MVKQSKSCQQSTLHHGRILRGLGALVRHLLGSNRFGKPKHRPFAWRIGSNTGPDLFGIVSEGDLVRAADVVILIVQRVQRRLEGHQVAVPQVVGVRQAPLSSAVCVAPVIALPARKMQVVTRSIINSHQSETAADASCPIYEDQDLIESS